MKQKVFVLGIFLSVGAVYFLADPGFFSFFPRCIFKTLTGWDCPACGLQRAFHALLHGRFAEALAHNYFLLVAIPVLVLVALTECVFPPSLQNKWRRALYHRHSIAALIALTLLWGIGRNIL
ncbi:MAG: DUF2752 domain-containing protein [Bacteroidaceae bacterium]|nr:DUF2752 domain-containing protein [Bacteroidaceae bacterium]